MLFSRVENITSSKIMDAFLVDITTPIKVICVFHLKLGDCTAGNDKLFFFRASKKIGAAPCWRGNKKKRSISSFFSRLAPIILVTPHKMREGLLDPRSDIIVTETFNISANGVRPIEYTRRFKVPRVFVSLRFMVHGISK
jgi:hypothetical protein